MIVGKPNFAQQASGILLLSSSSPANNNLVEASVRRNVNQAIRVCITQLQDLQSANPSAFPAISILNNDDDVSVLRPRLVGRSVYESFDYGNGTDSINQINQVGNQSANYNDIGRSYSRRKIAMENIKVLDVEAIAKDHINSFGGIYNIDQMYATVIDDEEISQPLYVYECSYEMTENTGCLTRLKLCKENTIVDGARAV